ncbi:MAG: ABC transporter permease [Acetivibrionales bacterium]
MEKIANNKQYRGRLNLALDIRNIISADRIGLIIALIVMTVGFSLLTPHFFTAKNFENILISASLMGLVAVGESMLLIGGLMDLSPGSVAAFSGVLSSMLLSWGFGSVPTIIIAVLSGVVIGSLNAAIINGLKINAFIATLASQSILRGFAYILCAGRPVFVTDETFLKLGVRRILGIPIPVVILILTFIVFGIVLTKTSFGRNVYIVGGNATAARLAGISTKKISYILFMIMGGLAALGGAILTSRMTSGQPSAGINLEFDGITAAILGGIAMSGGVGSIFGTILGVLILQGFNNGLILLNVQSFWQLVAKGSLLLIALSFDYFRSRKRN